MSNKAVFVMSLACLIGCQATALNPQAARVMVTRTPAPAGCTYLGSIIGEQGGAIDGPLTSNANLAQGALNDMKNKAHALGGNYVVLENTQAGSTVREGSGGQTDVTHMGNAFKCPEGTANVVSSPAQANQVVVVGNDPAPTAPAAPAAQ